MGSYFLTSKLKRIQLPNHLVLKTTLKNKQVLGGGGAHL